MKITEIETPLIDHRSIISGKLSNQMKFIHIKDSSLRDCCVYFSVNAGSYNEKLIKGYKNEGIAHLVEHMLFMGTKKYPKENYFDKLISQNSGVANAYTTGFYTMYHFSTFNRVFEEIFDVFAHFFISPLFNKNSVQREINAVNNEFLNKYTTGVFIIEHLKNQIADEKSLTNIFSSGNNESIVDNIIDNCKDFYNTFYTPNNYCVSIYSSYNHDKIIKIIDDLFGGLSNNKTSIKYSPLCIEPNFYPKNKQFYIPVQTEKKHISYSWEIPNDRDSLTVFGILAAYMNSDLENSLSYYFIQNNINIDLHCFTDREGILNISLEILYDYNINIITHYIMSYLTFVINNIKYLEEFYSKRDKIKKFQYDNLFISDFNMLTEELGLIYNELNDNDDPKDMYKDIFFNAYSKIKFSKIKKLIIDNVTILIGAKKEIVTDINNTFVLFENDYKKNKFRGFNMDYYQVRIKHNIDKSIVKKIYGIKWKPINLKFKYNNLDIKYIKQVSKNIWFKYSNSDRCIITIIFREIKYHQMFIFIINDILSEKIDVALSEFISISYKILKMNVYETESFVITIEGFNDENIFKDLLETFFKIINNLTNTILEDQFNNYKNKIIKRIKDSLNSSPYKLNNNYKLYEVFYQNSVDKLINDSTTLKYKDFVNYYKNNFMDKKIVFYINGNNWNIINKYIKYTKFKDDNKFIKYPLLKSVTYRHINQNEKTNCIEVVIPFANTPKNYSYVTLITSVYSEIFFDNMRTKQQLGYIAWLYASNMFCGSHDKLPLYLCFLIQAQTDVTKNILDFIKSMPKLLNNNFSIKSYISDENYQVVKKTGFKDAIVFKTFDFKRHTSIYEEKRKITNETFINFIQDNIIKSNNIIVRKILSR